MTTVDPPDAETVTVSLSGAPSRCPVVDQPRPSPTPRRPVMSSAVPVTPPASERPTTATALPRTERHPVERRTAAMPVEAMTRAVPTRESEPPTAAIPEPGSAPAEPGVVEPSLAEDFLRQVYAETTPPIPFTDRLRQVRTEIDRTGLYSHTTHELTFGARIAWRNSARCIGRLYWQSLQVRDLRHLHDPADVAQESVGHLRAATRGGKVRSTITIFAPDGPERPGPRIQNDQLVRYAGHRNPDGTITGDPMQVAFTDQVVALGWPRPNPRGRFDVLPLLVTGGDGRSRLFDVPPDAVQEVRLRHPDLEWFGGLGLRWYAVPAISNMPLEVGGVRYPAAPFNGWYLDTEIGARNLADTDRYNLLPEIARRMGLDTSSVRTMWRDRALVELVRAVMHSYDAAGVTMADHHTESERFMTHIAREKAAGRGCPADWSWIVPPMSGGLTPVFHRYYDEPDPHARPAFLAPPGTS